MQAFGEKRIKSMRYSIDNKKKKKQQKRKVMIIIVVSVFLGEVKGQDALQAPHVLGKV
jgi:hypothetical protein